MSRLTRMRVACLGVAAAVVFSAACGGGAAPAVPTDPAVPAVPLAPVVVLPQVRVSVTDATSRKLAGARVEIVTGSAAGTTLTTDDQGAALFTGGLGGVIGFRVSKDGFVTANRTFDTATACTTCGVIPGLHFALESTSPAVQISPGAYRLTIEAGSSCPELPPAARKRDYAATISAATGEFAGLSSVKVADLLFMQDSFLIGISDDYLVTEDGGAPTLFGATDPDVYEGIDFLIATSEFRIVDGGVAIPFTATFDYCTARPGTPPAFCQHIPAANLLTYARCRSENSLMTLIRQ